MKWPVVYKLDIDTSCSPLFMQRCVMVGAVQRAIGEAPMSQEAAEDPHQEEVAARVPRPPPRPPSAKAAAQAATLAADRAVQAASRAVAAAIAEGSVVPEPAPLCGRPPNVRMGTAVAGSAESAGTPLVNQV